MIFKGDTTFFSTSIFSNFYIFCWENPLIPLSSAVLWGSGCKQCHGTEFSEQVIDNIDAIKCQIFTGILHEMCPCMLKMRTRRTFQLKYRHQLRGNALCKGIEQCHGTWNGYFRNKYMDELSFILNMKGAAKNEYPFIKSLDKKCRSE